MRLGKSEEERKIYEHYQDDSVNSMEDMNQVDLETRMIMKEIPRDRCVNLLDCGCGEGISTQQYASIPNVKVTGLDASETRIKKAKERCPNVEFICSDIFEFKNNHKYDVIVSQRFLSNIPEWENQKLALSRILCLIKNKNSRLILMEGSIRGHNEMNLLKGLLGMSFNSIKWHNTFLDDDLLEEYMKELDINLVKKDGIGAYILLTRCIRPFFEKDLAWDCKFNKVASSDAVNSFFKTDKFSRIKMWVYDK